jgi:hypothetical protein
MATERECPLYRKDCGFVKFRKNSTDKQVAQLPESGDCGINPEGCPRKVYAETRNHESRSLMNDICGVKDILTEEKPINQEEMKVIFPLIPNNNGRPERRLTGGGHR